jgi:hypothetical protein
MGRLRYVGDLKTPKKVGTTSPEITNSETAAPG